MIPFDKPLHSLRRNLALMLMLPATLVGAIALPTLVQNTQAQVPQTQTSAGRALTVRSDIQEANSKTGVITARGNVQMYYPARQIQATAAQAQYFTKERRIILSGNVYVLQQGNSMRGETITYLIDEGRFIAVPQSNRQVESIYIVTDPANTTSTPAPKTKSNSKNSQPASKKSITD